MGHGCFWSPSLPTSPSLEIWLHPTPRYAQSPALVDIGVPSTAGPGWLPLKAWGLPGEGLQPRHGQLGLEGTIWIIQGAQSTGVQRVWGGGCCSDISCPRPSCSPACADPQIPLTGSSSSPSWPPLVTVLAEDGGAPAPQKCNHGQAGTKTPKGFVVSWGCSSLTTHGLWENPFQSSPQSGGKPAFFFK